MFDISFITDKGLSAIYYFLFLCVYCILICKNRDLLQQTKISSNKSVRLQDRFLLLFCILFLSIFAFTRGDFFSYADVVYSYEEGQFSTLDDFYLSLIIWVDHNYFLWRLIVWGGALLLFAKVADRLNINKVYALLFLCLFYILLFNYARASLAFCVYVYGLSFILNPVINKYVSYAIGIAIMYSSHYFHSTAYMLLFLTPMIYVPFNKRNIILLLLAIPFISSIIAPYILNSSDIALNMGDEFLSDKISNYQENTDIQFNSGPSAFILYTLRYSAFYVPCCILSIAAFRHSKKYSLSIYIINLLKMVWAISIFAMCIYIVSDMPVFFYRAQNMIIVFIPLIFAYMHENNILTKKEEKLCYIICMLSIIYETVYGMYLKLL